MISLGKLADMFFFADKNSLQYLYGGTLVPKDIVVENLPQHKRYYRNENIIKTMP